MRVPVDRQHGHAVQPDRVRAVGRARGEDALLGAGGVAARVHAQDVAARAVQPREHDQLVAGGDALERRRRIPPRRRASRPARPRRPASGAAARSVSGDSTVATRISSTRSAYGAVVVDEVEEELAVGRCWTSRGRWRPSRRHGPCRSCRPTRSPRGCRPPTPRRPRSRPGCAGCARIWLGGLRAEVEAGRAAVDGLAAAWAPAGAATSIRAATSAVIAIFLIRVIRAPSPCAAHVTRRHPDADNALENRHGTLCKTEVARVRGRPSYTSRCSALQAPPRRRARQPLPLLSRAY